MPTATLALDEALDLARTGDIWLFRGRTPADRAIQLATNSPVNHVGMAVVLGDLPPLMWHAELGRSLPDVWSGRRQRGVQLHVLSDAVATWVNRYGQRAWVRQLSPEVTRAMEDADLFCFTLILAGNCLSAEPVQPPYQVPQLKEWGKESIH